MSRATRRQVAIEKKKHDPVRHIAAIAAVVVVVVIAMTAAYLGMQANTAQPGDNARQAALASAGAPMLGSPDAKVHIVEFLDPACGTCAMFFPMVKQWLNDAPDKLRLSVRHVAFHSGADYAVRVLEASRMQGKYWETLEAMLMSQRQWVTNHVVQPDRVLLALVQVGLDVDRLRADMDSAEVSARIEQDKQDSILLKVSATPEYFVNGRSLPSFGQQQLLDLVREELSKAY